MDDNTLLILFVFLAILFLSSNGNLTKSICGNMIEGFSADSVCRAELGGNPPSYATQYPLSKIGNGVSTQDYVSMLNRAAGVQLPIRVKCQNNSDQYDSSFADYVEALRDDVMPSYHIEVAGPPYSFSVIDNN